MRSFRPEFRPASPMLDSAISPAGVEAEDLSLIFANLSELSRHASDGVHCYALYAETRGNEQAPPQWGMIAARQLIIELYNVRKAIDACHSLVKASGAIRAFVPQLSLQSLVASFKAQFPNTTELRQSVMHAAELTRDRNRRRETALKKPKTISGSIEIVFGNDQDFSSQGNLINDDYQVTYAGNLYTVSLNPSQAKILASIPKEAIDISAPLGFRSRDP
jgi:hypothetical protein